MIPNLVCFWGFFHKILTTVHKIFQDKLNFISMSGLFGQPNDIFGYELYLTLNFFAETLTFLMNFRTFFSFKNDSIISKCSNFVVVFFSSLDTKDVFLCNFWKIQTFLFLSKKKLFELDFVLGWCWKTKQSSRENKNLVFIKSQTKCDDENIFFFVIIYGIQRPGYDG